MKKMLLWISLFSIAMGFLETSVVVYLRIILYPDGFEFPLKPISNDVVVVELWREAATMLMLVGAGIMAGKSALEKFAYFLYSFAVWDIFYYVFLKILLDWPESFLTWDVLFLIPVTWTGPVISPIIISCLMIIMAIQFILIKNRIPEFRVQKKEWISMITGALVVIIAFCWDYSSYILKNHSVSKLWSLTESDLFDMSIHYIPLRFNWTFFSIGLGLILLSMYLIFHRYKSYTK